MVDKKSKDRLILEVNNKIEGIKELQSVRTQNLLVSAIFSKGAIDFIKHMHMRSRSNQKLFHHVYEWGQVGQESGRLFKLIKKQSVGGSASIYYKFNNSKTRSPIADVLRTPGSTGKTVTRSSIFKRKAEVMESGKSVHFIAQRNIAFSPDKKSIVFKREGSSITIRNPGGRATTGSFNKEFMSWWKINIPHILSRTAIIPNLEKSVARALTAKGAGRAQSRAAIESTLRKHIITRSVV